MSQSRNLRRLYSKNIKPHYPAVKKGLRGLVRRQTIAFACLLLAVCFVLGADYYKSAAILKTSKEVIVADKRQSVNWQDVPKILIDKRTGKRIDPQDAVLGGGDTCGSASVIGALPFNDSGTTVGTTDNYKLPPDTTAPTVTGCPTCTATGGGPAGAAPRGGVYTGTMTGPDVAYSITFTSANNSLDVTMTPTGGVDMALVVYTNVCSNNLADAIVVDDDGIADVAEHVTISNMPAGTYNIVVDGYSTGGTPPGPSGPYTLAVTGTGTIGTGATPTSSPSPTNTATATPTGSPSCNAATVSYTGPAVAIPDNIPAGVNINLPVSGVGAVNDLNFQFDTAGACDATLGNANAAMDHTFIGDLTFKLTPPDGSPTVSFQARRGGTRENICLSLLNDEGGFPNISTLTSVTGSPQSGNFTPETTGMLSLLDGENANGTWVLNVSDNAGIDTGSMRRFSLIFNSEGGCGSPVPTSTGTPATATNTPTNTPTPPATATATASPSPGSCSFSNGGLNPQGLTESGVAAPAGFFWSEVQHNTGNTTVSNTVSGFGAIQGANRLADNFTIGQPCTINSLVFYGYLTGAPATPSPFTAYTLQIWNGRPGDPGSVVVFGDTTTNRLASSVDTTYFRIFNTAVPPPGTVQGTTRKIWRNTVTVGTVLSAGTYWVDWASTVTGAANHFHPGKTIAGSRGAATDNARQLTVATGVWADALDTGNPVTPPSVPQDFPFDVVGTGGGSTPTATNTVASTATATATPTATGSPSCNATTVSYTGPAVAIPDNIPAGVNINLPVSGVGSVADLNFQFDTAGACDATVGNANAAMDHTFIGDLTFKLTPPDGSPTVSFQARRGGTRENICLSMLNDEGGFPNISTLTSVTGSAQSGNFTPETTGMLSLLDGENANGTWVLNVSDNAGIDTGSMRRFSLIFNSEGGCSSPTPTATATATATSTPVAGTSVQFSSATYTEDESQTAVITITRTGNTTGTTTVNFATSNGTATGGAACSSGVDYISVAQAVTFNPGETSKTVNVVICRDMLVESTQTVNLTLTGASVGSPATAVLNINDTANAFLNAGAICTTLGSPASPYPSTISVSGGPVQIGALRVTFYDVTHTMPDNMDFLLVSPTGRQMILQSDAGGLVDLVTPVTLTFADNAGQVLPDSAPLTTGVFEATSWQAGQGSFAAPAPPAPYNEPGSTVGGTPSLMSVFGLSNANGTWSLYMRDDANLFAPAAITGCLNGGWGLEFLTSTAAQASISGRVVTASGQGIRNARIVVTGNSLSQPIIVTTGSFGYYTIDGLATGETYVVTVNSQRYTFSTPSRVISLVDNIADANFIAEPQD